MFSSRNKKIIFGLFSISLLSGALISSVTGLLHNRIMTPNIQEYLSLFFLSFLCVCPCDFFRYLLKTEAL